MQDKERNINKSSGFIKETSQVCVAFISEDAVLYLIFRQQIIKVTKTITASLEVKGNTQPAGTVSSLSVVKAPLLRKYICTYCIIVQNPICFSTAEAKR